MCAHRRGGTLLGHTDRYLAGSDGTTRPVFCTEDAVPIQRWLLLKFRGQVGGVLPERADPLNGVGVAKGLHVHCIHD